MSSGNVYQIKFEEYQLQGYTLFDAFEITLELYLDNKPSNCKNRDEQFWCAPFLAEHKGLYEWTLTSINAQLVVTQFFTQTAIQSHPLIIELFQSNIEMINETIRLSGMTNSQNKFHFHKALIEKYLDRSPNLQNSYNIIAQYGENLRLRQEKIAELKSKINIKCPLQLYVFASVAMQIPYQEYCNHHDPFGFVNEHFIPVMGRLCSEYLLSTEKAGLEIFSHSTEEFVQAKIKEYRDQFHHSREGVFFKALYHCFLRLHELEKMGHIFSFERGIEIMIQDGKLVSRNLSNKEDKAWKEIDRKLKILFIYWNNRPVIEYPELTTDPTSRNALSALIYAKQIHGINDVITLDNSQYNIFNALLGLGVIKQPNDQWINCLSKQQIAKDNHFWISSWNDCQMSEQHQSDLFAINPIFEIGGWCFYQPNILQLYYSQIVLVNRTRILFNNTQEQRILADAIEENINHIFQIRSFSTLVGWMPNVAKYPDAGEIDLMVYRDNMLFVIEVKSTYIRDKVDQIHYHMQRNQLKAGRQLKRKVKAVKEELSINQELRAKLQIDSHGDDIEVVPLIIDTSIENDHQEFYGALKISLEELIIAISDQKDLLDPRFLYRIQQPNTELSTLYPNNSFTATRFIEVIRNNEIWERGIKR